MSTKPTHARPQLYAQIFIVLKELAKEYGYNLVVHGSLARDLDLIAIPWVDDPKPELEMIKALHRSLTGYVAADGSEKDIYRMNVLPGGRNVYTIDLYRGGYKRTEVGDIADPIDYTEDPQYYLDISVTPLVPA